MPIARIAESPEDLARTGRILLWAGFILALALLFAAVREMTDGIWMLPVALVAGLGAFTLFRREYLNLWVTLGLFVLIAGYEEGLQLEEVAYGLYFVLFLGLWYGRRFYFGGTRFISNGVDLAVAIFLVVGLLSVTWATLFGAKPTIVFGEMLVLLMAAFYFPIREACARDPERALRMLTIVLLWLGLFVLVRNVFTYRVALTSAEELYQITKGRVALNEVLQVVPALGALVVYLFGRTKAVRSISLLCFLLFLTGVIITQSRGYWAALGLGGLTLFLMVGWRHRIRLIILAVGGFSGALLLGVLFFPAIINLIVAGLVGRLFTLVTAFTEDLSMVNRFYETAEVWSQIKANPIIGYGIGREYEYFNLVDDATLRYAFVHNAYFGVWYKYGILGIGAVLILLIKSVVIGVRLYRTKTASPLIRSGGLIVAVCIVAEMLVANTSNPFLIADGTLAVAALAAVASGCSEYLRTGSLPSTDRVTETDG